MHEINQTRHALVDAFEGGQSNPTYKVAAASGNYVLRRKPMGDALPSAHAVDREYRVLAALAETGVPVLKVHALCLDQSVIGSIFRFAAILQGISKRALIGNATNADAAQIGAKAVPISELAVSIITARIG